MNYFRASLTFMSKSFKILCKITTFISYYHTRVVCFIAYFRNNKIPRTEIQHIACFVFRFVTFRIDSPLHSHPAASGNPSAYCVRCPLLCLRYLLRRRYHRPLLRNPLPLMACPHAGCRDRDDGARSQRYSP